MPSFLLFSGGVGNPLTVKGALPGSEDIHQACTYRKVAQFRNQSEGEFSILRGSRRNRGVTIKSARGGFPLTWKERTC
jgi:hypothetical protein